MASSEGDRLLIVSPTPTPLFARQAVVKLTTSLPVFHQGPTLPRQPGSFLHTRLSDGTVSIAFFLCLEKQLIAIGFTSPVPQRPPLRVLGGWGGT